MKNFYIGCDSILLFEYLGQKNGKIIPLSEEEIAEMIAISSEHKKGGRTLYVVESTPLFDDCENIFRKIQKKGGLSEELINKLLITSKKENLANSPEGCLENIGRLQKIRKNFSEAQKAYEEFLHR